MNTADQADIKKELNNEQKAQDNALVATSPIQQFSAAINQAKIKTDVNFRAIEQIIIDENLIVAQPVERNDIYNKITSDQDLQKIKNNLLKDIVHYYDFLNTLKHKYANATVNGTVPKGLEQSAVPLYNVLVKTDAPDQYILPNQQDLNAFHIELGHVQGSVQITNWSVQEKMAALAVKNGLKPFDEKGNVNTNDTKLFLAYVRSYMREIIKEEVKMAKSNLVDNATMNKSDNPPEEHAIGELPKPVTPPVQNNKGTNVPTPPR